jgi:glycosyltransferase involved in cell wall biosynthesis
MIETTSENLMSYFKTADVFLMTDDSDDHDNLIAKASANGCPVVCTPIGVAPLVIKDGDSGFVCASTDVTCFTTNIHKIMTDAGIRSRIRLNSSLFIEDAVGGTKEGYLKLIRDGWQLALKNGTSNVAL